MRHRGLFLVLLSAFATWGCGSTTAGGHAGGQSGTEGATPYCAIGHTRSVNLDEETPVGTARERFDSVPSLWTSGMTSLRWYPPDGSSSYVDTTLTLSFSGSPTTATYFWDTSNGSDNECGTRVLSIEGGVLQFQTADGAFDESIPGTVAWYPADNGVSGWPQNGAAFYASPAAKFTGSYDIAAATRRSPNARISLVTNVSPAEGGLSVVYPSTTSFFTVATWSTTGAGGNPGGAGTNGAADAGIGGTGG
ncbi:MAG: hypothetical protein ABI548_27850 [Polyangiaceae bacterium]